MLCSCLCEWLNLLIQHAQHQNKFRRNPWCNNILGDEINEMATIKGEAQDPDRVIALSLTAEYF